MWLYRDQLARAPQGSNEAICLKWTRKLYDKKHFQALLVKWYLRTAKEAYTKFLFPARPQNTFRFRRRPSKKKLENDMMGHLVRGGRGIVHCMHKRTSIDISLALQYNSLRQKKYHIFLKIKQLFKTLVGNLLSWLLPSGALVLCFRSI